MKCRCGHGRHTHRRASGKKNLPCQYGHLVRVRHAPFDKRLTEPCKCRNYTPKEG